VSAERIHVVLKPILDAMERSSRTLFRVSLTLGFSYVCATIVSSWSMSGLLKASLADASVNGKRTRKVRVAKGVNYHDVRKRIMDRNLFNSEGEFPDEARPNPGQEEKRQTVFDLEAPCAKTSLSVELLGTIYSSGTDSLAIVKESGFESDIYREGDAIIDHEEAKVARIERTKVIINNNGTKECIELKKGIERAQTNEFAKESPPGEGGNTAVEPDAPKDSKGGGEVTLEESYVQEQLGPGFGTIITKARLVPNTDADSGTVNGFKIFAIDRKSLLNKVGLKNGDIITQVNDTSLKQPDQGFALYQSLQDEREIAINILRGGKKPMTLNVRIK
jgi:type II secretion system protein C